MELWGKDAAFRGTVCPVFYTRAGERVMLPSDFQDAATESHLPCAASAVVIVICSDRGRLSLIVRRIPMLLM
jgi:hypothetical protein